MPDIATDLHGVRVLDCAADGPIVRSGSEANDLIGAAWSARATLAAVPLARLDPAFLDLRSGLAGEVIQKFVNYNLRLAVVGDVSAQVAASRALRDFVYESNRGRHVWFVADMAELAARLAAA
jgi:hypothetical protein